MIRPPGTDRRTPYDLATIVDGGALADGAVVQSSQVDRIPIVILDRVINAGRARGPLTPQVAKVGEGMARSPPFFQRFQDQRPVFPARRIRMNKQTVQEPHGPLPPR